MAVMLEHFHLQGIYQIYVFQEVHGEHHNMLLQLYSKQHYKNDKIKLIIIIIKTINLFIFLLTL